MSQPFPVTAQMVVKNEDRFVWFAIKSILPYVEKFLITDNGSVDQTRAIIESFNDQKIIFETQNGNIVKIRQNQLLKTKTPWFLLIDGDEVWPQRQLIELLQLTKDLPKEKIAAVNETKNCVGDVWHCSPKEAGKYHLGKWQGNLNIRLMRTLPYKIVGTYPWEEYQLGGKPINEMTDRLVYSNSWYLHLSHLNRSSSQAKTLGRRRLLIEKGENLKSSQLPEVFFARYPATISDPLARRDFWYELKANLLTPIKKIKRQIC